MLQQTTMAFLGGGNMAEAMIRGLLGKGLANSTRLIASDPVPERRELLRERHHIRTTADNREAAQQAEIVVLSVKPQVISGVLSEIRGALREDAMVLSIVAGVPLRALSEPLQHAHIIRVMPNTPAMIGEGMSVWIAAAGVSADHKSQARLILQALGDEIEVQDERYLDMATALSGSGPAYVFLFVEALTDAGVHMGFSRDVAQKLVLQTVQGSIAYLKQSGRHPVELRNMVTSPGGTTAEGIYQLEKGGLRTAVAEAVWAAYKKSRNLGGTDDQ